MTTTAVGRDAESDALTFLTARGLKLIERNYRCKFGEIDLVMLDKDTICFVEVRFRSSDGYVDGVESITKSKVQRLVRTAEHYIANNRKREDLFYRFDVLSLGTTVDWIQNAFSADD